MEPMTNAQAQVTVRDFVCSSCYGPLRMAFAPDGLYIVECVQCLGDTPGFVSKHHAERRKSESFFERVEAEQNLAEVFGRKPIPIKDILKELGY